MTTVIDGIRVDLSNFKKEITVKYMVVTVPIVRIYCRMTFPDYTLYYDFTFQCDADNFLKNIKHPKDTVKYE